MSIEVILKEHVEHLGRRGEVVKVASGYARNFLFPRKLALAVTDENKQQIERERAKAEAREAEELQGGAGAGRRGSRRSRSSIARRVGENDTLYGSVTSADIADALAARDLTSIAARSSWPIRSRRSASTRCRSSCTATSRLKVKVVAASRRVRRVVQRRRTRLALASAGSLFRDRLACQS